MYATSQYKHWLRLRLGLGVVLYLLGLQPLQAERSTDRDETLGEQQQLVRDLIAAETQQLQTASTAKATPIKAQKSVVDGEPDVVLHAVYGVGQRLVAEVAFRGESYLYLRGQVWPLGDPQGRSQLRLLELSSRCVRLAHKEQHFDACISP